MRSAMEKAFGILVRQLRLQKGYSLRELARRIDLSPNFLSKMELGYLPPPGEKKIVLIAETLEQNTDELLALTGKVSSDLIEIILQRPKETAALLRRLRHAAVAQGIAEDIEELRRRTVLHGEGLEFGGEVVRVIEEYPSTAAELAEMLETADIPKDIGLVWLRRLLRRGRKYRMKVFAVAQEFSAYDTQRSGD